MANIVFPRNVNPHVQQGLGIWTKVKFYWNICGRIFNTKVTKIHKRSGHAEESGYELHVRTFQAHHNSSTLQTNNN
jgi:hypothetical protein